MEIKKEKKSRIPLRINILFFVIFILFSILIGQLGVVQILEGKSYQEEIDRTVQDISKSPVPRGKMYDRNGELIVDNKPLYAITYTPPKRVQADQKLELAEKLVQYMKLDQKEVKKVTDRNKKEYFYLKNTDEVMERLTKKEKEEDDVKQYQIALEKITDEEIKNFSKEQLQIMAIKRQLDKAYALTPEVIKNENISTEEYARIAENLHDLPGINATTDWEREYKYEDTLKSIVGSITSQDQGIPAEQEKYYLTRGYSRNDRVGKSGLEEQYEEVLRGRKQQVEYTTTKTGQLIGSDIAVPGERGKDLVLTMDMDFQKKVDDILEKELKAGRSRGNTYLEDTLAVVMNPKTGEILALSGQHYNKEEDKYESTPHKVLYDSHRPGSTIKGATVLAGLDSGVISPGTTFYDSPIKVRGTKTKGSWTTGLGSVNDITALKKSSNVYMFYIGLRMGGEYRYPFPNEGVARVDTTEGFKKMRYYFNQFGLGLSTGIDFPFEATGFVGVDPLAGNIMDIAIGQYDTYTTMQLAQYIATIANDGQRIQPRLVKEIRSPGSENELGPVAEVHHPKMLNKVQGSDEYIDRIQQGFWSVFNESGGTGYGHWAGTEYKAAGKTGTAENAVYLKRADGTPYSVEVINLTLVGYAPYDDPEVAFAVIVPQLGSKTADNINHKIGRQIMDAYFDIKAEKEEEEEEI